MSYINLFSIKNYPMSRDMPGPEKSPGNGNSDAFPGVYTTYLLIGYFLPVSGGSRKRFFYKPVIVSVFQ
jgi:hypothetical protein